MCRQHTRARGSSTRARIGPQSLAGGPTRIGAGQLSMPRHWPTAPTCTRKPRRNEPWRPAASGSVSAGQNHTRKRSALPDGTTHYVVLVFLRVVSSTTNEDVPGTSATGTPPPTRATARRSRSLGVGGSAGTQAPPDECPTTGRRCRRRRACGLILPRSEVGRPCII